jgi:hypothetical protein
VGFFWVGGLHVVRGEFSDDVLETAVGSDFAGHEYECRGLYG